MRKDRERGAIVVEATLSLTAFVFTLFTILSIVNIYFIQAKMSIALDAASKEISQYSYLYYKLGVNNLEAKLTSGTEDARATAEQTIDGIGSLMNSLSEASNSISTGDFDQLISSIESGYSSVDSLVTMYADKLADDPKGFIIGMGKMAGNELKEETKVVLGQVLAKSFMKKNLMAYKGDDPDAFLKRYRVVDGMEGLDFDYSALMAYGTSNKIQLCVTYDVEVLKLLNIDIKFKFRQVAQTTAWGNGVSLMHPENNVDSSSLWDLSTMERGKAIVLEEKKNYTYTSSGQGFDAYDNSNGKNEFITICSADPAFASNATPEKLADHIASEYRKLYSKVGKLKEEIVVQYQSETSVTLRSNEESRTYKVVMIVPESTSDDYIAQAKQQFISDRNALGDGDKVVVEIKRGYGNPSTQIEKTEEDK